MNSSTQHTPPLVKGHFLWGQLLNAKKEGVYFYDRLFKEYGDAFHLRIFYKNYYIFLHPDYNREILVDRSDIFIKGDQYNPLRLLLGNGLLTAEGLKWTNQRRMLNPLFSKEGMDLLLTHIKKSTDKTISVLHSDKEINWSKLMVDYTLDVAIASFLGSNFKEEERVNFAKSSLECIRFVSRKMSGGNRAPFIFPTAENRNFRTHFKFLKHTIDNAYNERLHSTAPSKDMLDLLMRLKDENKSLTKNEVWDQLLSFMIAGHETTALTMSWLFHLLAKHPEIQEKIVLECEQNHFDFENSLSITNYPYLSAVINETMRLYPAGWIISRDVSEDTQVGQFKIKKGSVVVVSPLITHRDPRWWKNPESFTPERFIEGSLDYQTITKNSYLPFSIGKRNCIGARFAVIEIAVFVIALFKKYRVDTNQKEIKMKGHVTLKSQESIRIILRS